jgi:hypothetical protein
MPDNKLNNFLEVRKNKEDLELLLDNILINKKKDKEIIKNLVDLNLLNLKHAHKIYEKYTRYRNLMKRNKIIFNEYFETPIKKYFESEKKIINDLALSGAVEKFEDDMEKTIINNESHKLLKSIISNKYKHLTNDETFNIFREFYNKEVKREEIQNFIGKKIAQYKNPEEFNKSLVLYLNQKMGWSHDKYLEKIRSMIPDEYVYFTDDNKIIFEASSFDVSREFGSDMWCITRDEIHFNDYTRELDRLVFCYDFDKNPDDVESQIAYVVEPDNFISSAYYKDDVCVVAENYIDIEKKIKRMSERRLDEKFIGSLENSESIEEVYDLYKKALEYNSPNLLLKHVSQEDVVLFLDEKYSIRFDASRIANAAADKSFEFLNEYYVRKDNKEWPILGYYFMEKAAMSGNLKLAERIFDDPKFQKEIEFMKEENHIKKLPNSIVSKDLFMNNEKLMYQSQKLALKLMSVCDLSPEDTFSPNNTEISVFNFYKDNFPDFVEKLKESSTTGLLFINNLLSDNSSFKKRFEILKSINLNSEQKEKFSGYLEKNFKKAILNLKSSENCDNLIKEYKSLFCFFEKDDINEISNKDFISTLMNKGHYKAIETVLKNDMVSDDLKVSNQTVENFKTERNTSLFNEETKKSLDFIINYFKSNFTKKEKKKIRFK